MWCEYACNPVKANFLEWGDPKPAPSPATGDYPTIIAHIDTDYACGIFTSCAKESYISESGLTNSLSFLDFLGSNGAPYSLSWIEFALEVDSTVDNAMQGEEEVDYYPCEFSVPEDGLLLGYDGIYDTSCSYCDAACTPPVVDDKIAFLDGLSWSIVGYSYMAFVLLTILFQVVLHFCCQKSQIAKIKAELDRQAPDGEYKQTSGNTTREYGSDGR